MNLDFIGTLLPLTFLPGIGLLINSTSSRFINVTSEIKMMSPQECEDQEERIKKEIHRAKLFRNALIGLYLSVGFFSFAAFVSTLLTTWNLHAEGLTALRILIILGITSVVFASVELIQESLLSLDIVIKHTNPDKKQNIIDTKHYHI